MSGWGKEVSMSATIITLPMVAAALIILEQMLDWSTVGALQRRAGLGGFRGK